VVVWGAADREAGGASPDTPPERVVICGIVVADQTVCEHACILYVTKTSKQTEVN
jgi:hypothetical protein